MRRKHTTFLLIGTILYGISGCVWDGCSNQEVSRVASPDGKLAIVIFTGDCDGPSEFDTQVSIVSRGTRVDTGLGNTFVAQYPHGDYLANWTRPKTDVRWLTDRTIMISTDVPKTTLVQVSKVSVPTGLFSRAQVSIEYSITQP